MGSSGASFAPLVGGLVPAANLPSIEDGTRLLDRNYPTISPGIVNTTSETDVCTFTVLPADVAASDVLILEAFGDALNTSGSTPTDTWKLYLGATTVASGALTRAASTANRSKWQLRGEVHLSTLAVQRVWVEVNHAFPGASSLNGVATGQTVYGVGTGAEDFTTSKNLKFTVTMSTNHASLDVRPYGATLFRRR